jgi:drug/metabolite transporter (DMT)-like permease
MSQRDNDQTLPLDLDDETGSERSDGAAAASTALPLEPLHPRLGTIIWGCILLIVGGIAIFASRVDFSDTTPAVIVWSVVAFGAALVLAAIVTAIVRAVRRPRADSGRG